MKRYVIDIRRIQVSKLWYNFEAVEKSKGDGMHRQDLHDLIQRPHQGR